MQDSESLHRIIQTNFVFNQPEVQNLQEGLMSFMSSKVSKPKKKLKLDRTKKRRISVAFL